MLGDYVNEQITRLSPFVQVVTIIWKISTIDTTSAVTLDQDHIICNFLDFHMDISLGIIHTERTK